ncbi:MAG: M23 family metallopeptidase [Flammeovirgaceae bacterium]
MKRIITLLSFLIGFVSSYAQSTYTKDYYIFPIKPNQRNYLSGKMGELRSSHFHAGIDVKTEGREGLKVHAAADGYVYRIKVSSYGYGKVLYMQHANGQRTVYAHLQRFDEEIEKYVLKEQYKKEDFFIELFPDAKQFTFKQGEVIARAGNSGSSGGPHLHFEVRNNNDEPLKTLRFGFEEIVDRVPPVVQKIALRTKEPSARVNGEFGRIEFPIIKTRYSYQLMDDIQAFGSIGIDLYAFDKADGVHNKYGIYDLEVEVNGEVIHKHVIDQFSFFESRAIQVFTDYAHKKTARETFQHCYIEDGNDLPFFPMKHTGKGKLNIEDGKTYQVKLNLTDVFGNRSQVLFTIIGNKNYAPQKKRLTTTKNYLVSENAFQFYQESKNADEPAKVFARGFDYILQPAYRISNKNVYLWDLRDGLPDSITMGKQTKQLDFKQVIPSTIPYLYSGKQLDITFVKSALYDTLYLQTQERANGFSIQDRTVPLFKRIIVSFRPTTQVKNKAKTRLYYVGSRGRLSYEGGRWQGNQITVSTRTFGDYVLKEDVEKPIITLERHANNQLVFRIQDELAGVDKFRATLNGKFLLLKFDHRKDIVWTERLDKTKPLKGDFKLVVTDEVGNEAIYEQKL